MQEGRVAQMGAPREWVTAMTVLQPATWCDQFSLALCEYCRPRRARSNAAGFLHPSREPAWTWTGAPPGR
jgi:hypothetical protein